MVNIVAQFPRGHDLAVLISHHNAAIAAVGNVNDTAIVDRDTAWNLELVGPVSLAAPRRQETAFGRPFLNAVVIRIRHIDVTCAIEGYISGVVHLPVVVAFSAEHLEVSAVSIKNLYRVILKIGDVNIPTGANSDT
jgi:hypothetical protein